MTPLIDKDPFPFGVHKGQPMEQVPAMYLDWLIDQPWISRWPAIEEYIERNRKVIDKELKDEGVIE
jgi:hypothetical protein